MDGRCLARLGALGILPVLLSITAERAVSQDVKAAPKTIRPEQARQHVGERCVVTFVAKKTKHAVR